MVCDEMMKKRLFDKYAFIFVLFMVGSLIGFVYENLLTLIQGHYELRQGLIYEPLIPIYGLGVLLFYLLYNSVHLEKHHTIVKIMIVFLIGFVMGGLTEYICSYIQEKVFGTISWDYSYLKYDINGRTSLWHCFVWGMMGALFYIFVLPLLEKTKQYLKYKWVNIIVIICSIILFCDCIISWIACHRQTQRREGIEATNFIDKLLDQYYPDEYLNRIFNNAKPTELEK